MKLIVGIIKPFKVDDVTTALRAMGVHGLTVTEVKGYGRRVLGPVPCHLPPITCHLSPVTCHPGPDMDRLIYIAMVGAEATFEQQAVTEPAAQQRYHRIVEAAYQAPVRAVYLTPHHQLPTTVTLGAERRRRLERLLAGLESGDIRVVARDLTEPSPLAREVLTARPYAYLDDAPLEERRTQAGTPGNPRPAAEAAAAGILPDLHLGPDGPVMLTHDGAAVSPVPDEGTGNGSGC